MMKNVVSLVVLVTAAMASTVDAQCGEYTEVFGPPGPTYDHQFTYDPVRQNLVTFGGSHSLNVGPFPYPTDGMLFGSDGWQRTPVGPNGERWAHALVWDPSIGATRLIGGLQAGSFFSMTDGGWIWNGNTWLQSNSSFIRECVGAYFDQSQGRMVVIGRTATGYIFTGGFSYITTAQNLPSYAGFAYDPTRNRAVVHGGSNSSGVQNDDTWEFDGSTWTRVATVGPGAREDHRMVYDPVRQKVVLHGGLRGSSTVSDTWTWDGQQWEQISTVNALPRRHHAMFWDPRTQRVNVHGGLSTGNQILGDMRELVGDTWTQTDIGLPPAQAYSTMVYDSWRDSFLLCAASAGNQACYIYRNNVWRLGPPMPAATPSRLVMAFDEFRGTIVGVRLDNGQTWLFDGTTWTVGPTFPATLNLPNVTMGYDPGTKRVIALSRRSAANSDQGHAWDGNTWVSVPALPTTSGLTPVMATDYRRGTLYGYNLSNIYKFVGTGWEPHSSLYGSFLALANPQFIYDGSRDRLQIRLGVSTGPIYLYEYDGQSWVTSPFLANYYIFSSCTDTRRRRQVGLSPSAQYMSRTRVSVDVTAEQSLVKRCGRGSALLKVLIGPQGAQQYQWYRDSTFELLTDGVSASGTLISGATTPTLTLGNVTPRDLGVYFCRVTNACGPTDSFPITVVPDVCIAEFNCDGQISPTDIFDYLNAWFAGDQSADVDGAAGLAASDIFAFLNAWFSGC